MTTDDRLVILMCVTIMTIAVCALKGCQAVYSPDALRADAEARVLLHKEYHEQAK
jgi:hypothetical protein